MFTAQTKLHVITKINWILSRKLHRTVQKFTRLALDTILKQFTAQGIPESDVASLQL